jgi:hypothetical protein
VGARDQSLGDADAVAAGRYRPANTCAGLVTNQIRERGSLEPPPMRLLITGGAGLIGGGASTPSGDASTYAAMPHHYLAQRQPHPGD